MSATLVELVCRACNSTKQFVGGATFNGKPVEDWFRDDCDELCKACRGAVKAARAIRAPRSALADPTAPGVSLHSVPRDTELTAAQLAYPKSGTQRETVLRALAAVFPDGLTDDEISTKTGLYRYSAAPRRNELLGMGWVEDSGLRRTSPLNRPEVVWRLTNAGYQQLP